MEKSKLIRPFNLEKSKEVAKGKAGLRKLKIGGLFGSTLKIEEEYFFNKEVVKELIESVSNFKGFKVHPVVSPKGSIIIYLEPIGEGIGPIPGPGVGTSPPTT